MPTPAQAVDGHYHALRNRGLDLGNALAPLTASGSGGFVRRYARGNIYWHANTGAFEVHGGILTRYLNGGGPGANPATGVRELGYPTSDEHASDDGEYPVSNFEWGTIAWVPGTGGVRLFGPLFNAWRSLGGVLGALGAPMLDVTRLSGGSAAWFERGVLWHADGSDAVLIGVLIAPQLGCPQLVDPQQPVFTQWVRFSGAIAALDSHPTLAADLWRDRLVLVPIAGAPSQATVELAPSARALGSGTERLLDFTAHAPHPMDGGGVLARVVTGLEVAGGVVADAGSPLVRRTLYSLALRSPGRAPIVISPHCVYARSDWATFNLAHITDLHISRRIESYRKTLRAAGVAEDNIALLNNWNDAFRDFIRYANHLHSAGLLDAILATGDLVDYVREVGDHPHGPGNFRLFENLVRGQAPSPDRESPPSEALRVPVFTSLGNHDYRANPYPLLFKVKISTGSILGEIPFIGDALEDLFDGVGNIIDAIPGLGLIPLVDPIAALSLGLQDTQRQYQGLNVTAPEAQRLIGLRRRNDPSYYIPVLKPEVAAKSVLVDPAMRDGTHYYFRRLNRRRSYTVPFGINRVVMLDTRHDKDITTSVTDGLITKLGFGTESSENFMAGSPDSVGIDTGELALLQRAIGQAGAAGFVVVGMHAPPLNPMNNEMLAHFRETMHGVADVKQVTAFLRRVAPAGVVAPNGLPLPTALTAHASWPRNGTPYFHIGTVEDLLDYGIAIGQQEELVKLFAGASGARPVTLVLSGHGHRRFDYRLRWNAQASKVEFYTDHYLENPPSYYPMRLAGDKWWVKDAARRYLVPVEAGAPVTGAVHQITDNRPGAVWKDLSTFNVPPYASPLASASTPAEWWRAHAPVVVQTAALGPGSNTRADKDTNADVPGPNFQGFRILQVASNTITRVRYITMPELRAAGFRLPWERGAFRPPVVGGAVDVVLDAALEPAPEPRDVSPHAPRPHDIQPRDVRNP